MNTVCRLPSPVRGDESRGAASPLGVPATPYEHFIAEKEKCYRLLLNAGIDDDMAIETAIHVAMEKTTAKLNPDDYEFCNNVYGEKNDRRRS